VTGEDTGHVNMRMLRLLVATKDQVQVMPGTVIRSGIGDQKICFAANGLYRIRNGKRRGMFVEPTRLRPGENGSKAGLIKSLKRGKDAIRAGDKRDHAVIETLCQGCETAVEVDSLIYPAFYIRAQSTENLTVRMRGEVTKQLMALDGYSRALPLEDNFSNLGNAFAIADGDHWLYPFDMVCGLGLVMFDKDTLPPAQWLPLDALAGDDFIEVRQ